MVLLSSLSRKQDENASCVGELGCFSRQDGFNNGLVPECAKNELIYTIIERISVFVSNNTKRHIRTVVHAAIGREWETREGRTRDPQDGRGERS